MKASQGVEQQAAWSPGRCRVLMGAQQQQELAADEEQTLMEPRGPQASASTAPHPGHKLEHILLTGGCKQKLLGLQGQLISLQQLFCRRLVLKLDKGGWHVSREYRPERRCISS